MSGRSTSPRRVEVTEPFGIFRIFEVRPHVIVQFLKPRKALLVARQLVGLDHRDRGFDMHPPQFLIPFELLLRTPEAIHEIEYAAVLFVPAVFDGRKRDLHGLPDQIGAAEPLAPNP